MTAKVNEAFYLDFELNSAGLVDVVVKVIKCTTAGVLTDFSASVSAVTEITTGATSGWYRCNFTPDVAAYYFWRARSASTGKYVGGVLPVEVGMLADSTYGLSALQVLAAAIKAKTDNLPADPGDQSSLEAAIVAAAALIMGADGDDLKDLSDALDQFAFTGTNVHARLKAMDDIDISATMKASVNAEVDTALSDIDVDHLTKNTAGATKPTDGSLFDQIMSKGCWADVLIGN